MDKCFQNGFLECEGLVWFVFGANGAGDVIGSDEGRLIPPGFFKAYLSQNNVANESLKRMTIFPNDERMSNKD